MIMMEMEAKAQGSKPRGQSSHSGAEVNVCSGGLTQAKLTVYKLPPMWLPWNVEGLPPGSLLLAISSVSLSSPLYSLLGIRHREGTLTPRAT